MRLRRLDLTRYGKFTDYSIDFGARRPGTPDLHIVYGLNEAGKSTALSGYLDLLFGIEERTRYGFLHGYSTMEIGAALEFGDGVHDLRRVKQRGTSLRDGRGQPANEALLGVPLAGLSRDAYRMMFSLDDQTLEAGGDAILESKGDLGELLFSASAGLADLSHTLDAVEKEADGIYRKRVSKTKIAELKHRLAELKDERARIDVQASAHAALVAMLNQAGQAYDEAVRERALAKARHEELGRVLRAAPLVNEYRRASQDYDELAGLPHPPAHWAAELPGLMAEDTRLHTRLAGLDDRTERLRDEIAGIDVDERLLALGERLDRLTGLSELYSGAERDLPKRRAGLAALEGRIGVILRTLGREGEADPQALLVPAPVVGTLRDLIEQRSGVAAALEAAREEFAAAERGLERARADCLQHDAALASDATASLAALREIVARLRQSDLASRQRLMERDLPQLQRQRDEAFADLAPWSGNGSALRALAVPDSRQIEHWRARLSSIETRRAALVESLRGLRTQQRELEARIGALQAVAGTLDDASAARLRAERDAAWQSHLAAMDGDSARAFEGRMRTADSIADARLAKANDLAELRSLATAHALAQAQVERQQELFFEVDEELASLRAEMGGTVPAASMGEAQASLSHLLAAIERWTKRRDVALAADERLQAQSAELDVARSEAARERDRLAAALEAIGVATASLALAVMVEMAEAALTDAADRRKAREAADLALREREREIATRTRALEAASAAMETWQQRWDAALKGRWFSDHGASIGGVRAILDALGTLASELRERTELQHRADAMESDRQAFTAELTEIFAALGERLDSDAVLVSARALMQRHERAKQDRQRRDEKAAECASLAGEREHLLAAMAVHEASKAALLAFFDAADLVEVSHALAQCAARDRVRIERERLAAQITAELQAASIDEALARFDDIDRAEVARESAELAGRLDDLDERVTQLFADRSRAEDRLNAIGGDDAVARLEAERRTVLLEIEDLALRYLRLKTGGLVATHALRAYREKHRSSMMQRASEAFRLITRDDYSGLATRPEKDREILIGISRNGGSKLAADMSKGTRFQLYLALRLAGYEEFAAARPSVPFIADDIMETFDEPRSEEVFRLFAQMATTGQVIYLTHHRHLCDMARQVVPDVRIHELTT
jgi:uncharacterized protein YhaN